MSETLVTETCESCGSPLTFDPAKGLLVCSNCGNEYLLDNITCDDVYERDFSAYDELEERTETVTVTCPNCGGESTFPENVLAGFCEFCKTPLVATRASQRSIRPSGMIPFAVPCALATENFKQWLGSLWFLPGDVKKRCQLAETLSGVYRPLWTFDYETRCYYTGRRGDDYWETVTRTVNGKTTTTRVLKTRWHYVSGWVQNAFDDVVVYAGTRIPRDIQEEVGNWQLGNAVDYREDLVLGFYEENYDVPRLAAYREAKEKALPRIDSSIRYDIGGDHQVITGRKIEYYDVTYKLLLVPFWQGRYFYKEKEYLYLVNGQTGKAHGERPWSMWKVMSFSLVMSAVVGYIIYLIYQELSL